MILPDMLPQFWHCTVRFSAPVRGDWNANVPLVWVEDKFGGRSKRERMDVLWVPQVNKKNIVMMVFGL
jgi:hypothetical protein